MSDYETIKSRTIRECMLRALWEADRAGVACGYSQAQLIEGFAGGGLEYSEGDLRSNLRDLVDDELVDRIDDRVNPGAHRYTITSRGRDFVRGKFPWGSIDEFTGDERMMP